jgi:hypothetical protein
MGTAVGPGSIGTGVAAGTAVGEGIGDWATGFADAVGLLDDLATGVVLEGDPQAPMTSKPAIAEAILNVNMDVTPKRSAPSRSAVELAYQH